VSPKLLLTELREEGWIFRIFLIRVIKGNFPDFSHGSFVEMGDLSTTGHGPILCGDCSASGMCVSISYMCSLRKIIRNSNRIK
jgi:hypothetical protein